MSIVTLLILILLLLAVAYAVVMFQIVSLARIYRSWAWWAGAGTMVLVAGNRIYNLLKLPSAILEAQRRGYMIESLTWQNWVDIGWAVAIVSGFITFFDLLRRELLRLGMK